MKINEQIYSEICEDAGEERVKKANSYVNSARVEISDVAYNNKDNFSVSAIVQGINDNYITDISVEDGELNVMSCQCKDYISRFRACKHIVATLMKFKQPKYWDKNYVENDDFVDNELIDEKKFLNAELADPRPIIMTDFRRIVNNMFNEQINDFESNNQVLDKKIKIEPKFIFDKYFEKTYLEFKIGNTRMYKIKDLKEFYFNILKQELFRYGDKLEFVHKKENFEEESLPLLDFIINYIDILLNVQKSSRYSYYESDLKQSSILVTENYVDELFDILKNQSVVLELPRKSSVLIFKDEDPDIKFELVKVSDDKFKIKPNKKISNIKIIGGRNYKYVYYQGIIYRCSEDFTNTVSKLINIFKEEYIDELELEKDDLYEFYSIVMPNVKNCINLKKINESEIEMYKPKKLSVKMFLDYDESDNIISDVKFCYGDDEFNPFDENENITSMRNLLDEKDVYIDFNKKGFLHDIENKRLILIDEDKIYDFLENGIEDFMKQYEIMATDKFKTKEIRKSKLGTIGIRVVNSLLELDMSKINIDKNELIDIMNKYKLKKRYHRLNNGSFINLEDNEELGFLDKLVSGMDIEYNELKEDVLKLPVNRTLYLNELLKKQGITNVTKDGEFKKIITDMEQDNINEDILIPEKMDNILRDYQKIGFRWLKVIDSYHFGGILADDMGLGKTLQVISIILDYIEQNNENRKTTIVVSPSSLVLNWKNEVAKFAPDLKCEVIKGNADERKSLISDINNYDIVITSYDLLKRDINEYLKQNYNFRYLIADEAQYMKNSNTQNAKAIKKISADTRFALTGTPIENSLAELWSIFDFVMPGYLFSYKKFKTLYESPIIKEQDGESMKKLKMLIEPFILRRNKKDVLTELPEKTITVINNQMEDEQEMIYLSYLSKIKQDVAQAIDINGFEKSQIKILAGLTRLRQICCHPGLFLEDYKGKSSKLNQCMELIDDAIESNHKILLFSGYTSMFGIIEKKLEMRNIKFFELTGNTKIDERIRLVDEFNSNPDIKVFLISLKAGGTGLNLTGADMVIHYDPWWNQSAENQATDRAYRIGQKNNVQVYKLITSNSIEEKIYELQEKKASLIDNMLDTKTSFINKLSKDEIMNLFN